MGDRYIMVLNHPMISGVYDFTTLVEVYSFIETQRLTDHEGWEDTMRLFLADPVSQAKLKGDFDAWLKSKKSS